VSGLEAVAFVIYILLLVVSKARVVCACAGLILLWMIPLTLIRTKVDIAARVYSTDKHGALGRCAAFASVLRWMAI
jgi:hypothetical protein